jgi:3-oxoacyl-[acyl-carrier protein] reductase
LEAFRQGVALARVGDPQELGALCTFLASDRAGFITGQVVLVDGGSVPTIF